MFKHYKWIKGSSAKTFKEKCLDHIELSTKLKVLFRFLQQWNGKERVLIFSQTTTMLDVIEEKCKQDNFKYVRLDGQVKDTDRPAVIKTFTDSDDVFVFLIQATTFELVQLTEITAVDVWVVAQPSLSSPVVSS